MDQTELKLIQKIELDMLKETIRICEAHGIPYYALGGTLLGAVRHKGFIPWDDDIDIGIPRPYYTAFMEAAMKELPDNMTISHFQFNPVTHRPVYSCQVINTDHRIRQYITKTPIETYVWIDIFPLDGMPDQKLLRNLHALYLLYRRMWIQFSMFDDNVHQFREDRPWYEKLLIKIYQKTRIGANRDTTEMMEKLDKALCFYDFNKCHYLINFMGAWKLKEMFPAWVYGNGQRYPFEDILINGPVNADYVLKQMYGDYMCPRQTENHHAIELIDKH